MNDVTRILSAIDGGDPHAAEQLLPLVYDELRKLAARRLAQEKPGQTLQATALVHEAYLRLVGNQDFENRRHFFAAAAEAMRHVLVDRARRRKRTKQGGGWQRVPLDEAIAASTSAPDELLAIDEALTRLEKDDPQAAAVVKLRYFAGLSADETAHSLGISRASVYRHWNFARAWLLQEIATPPSP
ncbi:MAG TPA: sigma-70 family RNA polymerase sigma factor [Gemmataceae bacterium]|nr:sigma-70 family RNA polymerase sigma factor [Gemmataceae bacterium]